MLKSLHTWLRQQSPAYWLLILILFGAGLAFRLIQLRAAPLDINPDRQLHSALVARGMYYQNLPTAPEWKRTLAVKQWQDEPVVEPPILETLVVTSYRLVGKEVLWIARLYSIAFWMVGGIFLFLLAYEAIGVAGGVVALLFFLLAPYGVISSRTFQPDPLMIGSMCAVFWAMLRWQRKPSMGWAVAAGLLTGWAVLVKTVDVFILAFAWAALVLATMDLRQALRSRQVWMIAVLSVLPAFIYFTYGTVTNLFGGGLDNRFNPSFWIKLEYYRGWLSQIQATIRVEYFLLGLLGAFLLRSRPLGRLLVGAWIGYLVFSFVLPYPVEYIPYYQLPAFPLVALGLGSTVQLLWDHLPPAVPLRIGLAMLSLLLIGNSNFNNVNSALTKLDYQAEIDYWVKISKQFPQGAAVLDMADNYGRTLRYYGWVNTTHWTPSGMVRFLTYQGKDFDFNETFNRAVQGKDFFLITISSELETQPELNKVLNQKYSVYKQGSGDNWFMIFDLRHPKTSIQ